MKKISNDVILGNNVIIYDFVNLYGCKIGDNTKIGTFVEIQKNVKIGNNCKISSHTFICEGVEIQDNVFIGHNVTFINDRYPQAINENGELAGEKDWKCEKTILKNGVSIGSSVTIMCGITIGENSLIGAGSTVLTDIPDNTIYAGNPAKFIRKK